MGKATIIVVFALLPPKMTLSSLSVLPCTAGGELFLHDTTMWELVDQITLLDLITYSMAGIVYSTETNKGIKFPQA